MFVDLIAYGYTVSDKSVVTAEITDAASAASTVTNSWDGAAYLMIKQGAWDNLKNYYNTIQ